MTKAKLDIQALQQQIADLTDALQRERADAENIRRHHEQQLTSLRTVAKASVVRDLLPVIDSFERALKHVPAELTGNDYIKGIEAVVKQFEKALQQLGVQKIKTIGHSFDPLLHEAVSMEEGEGDHEVVSEELQSGYMLGDEVLRHAVVRVRAESEGDEGAIMGHRKGEGMEDEKKDMKTCGCMCDHCMKGDHEHCETGTCQWGKKDADDEAE